MLAKGYLLLLLVLGCAADGREEYIQTHPQLLPEIVIGIQQGEIVVGMTCEQVKIVLGEPTFIKKNGELERWIYQGNSFGTKPKELYNPDSAFPQGIGFVVPFVYHAQEIWIDFSIGKVCRVQKMLY